MLNKSLLLPGLLVVSALVVALIILLGLQSPEQPDPAASSGQGAAGGAKPAAPVEAETSSFGSSSSFGGGSGFGGVSRAPAPVESEAAEIAEVPLQPWEQAINQILESDEANFQAAARLGSLLPTLPLEGQVEAAQHMVNLTDDENYQTASAMVLNPATPSDVVDVVFADALNRPNSIKLPLLVAILRVPGHRQRTEALSTLQVFTGEDLGDNPEAWNAYVQNFLANEAREEAAAGQNQ